MTQEDDAETEVVESNVDKRSPQHGDWVPEREDAEVVGKIGEIVRDLIADKASVWQVYSVPDTWSHILRNHGDQMDMRRARELLSVILQNPKIVYVTENKPNSIVFVGEYDELHDLVVAIKSIFDKNELWLSTMHKIQNDRLRSSAAEILVLYERRK